MPVALWFLLTIAISLSLGCGRPAQTIPALSEMHVWRARGSEILGTTFSNDGARIAFSRRVHWADGHEAEELPRAFFEGLQQRLRENPRFADPVITALDLAGNAVCERPHGWSPHFSPGAKQIAFSRQVRPISGLRELADTLKGNDLEIFDCGTKTSRNFSAPDGTSLDAPMFSADGTRLIFTVNEAVNGAMRGVVGIEEIDLDTGRRRTILEKRPVPSVPCPGSNLGMTDLQRFKCNAIKNLPTEFQRIVLQVSFDGSRLLVLTATPVPEIGDIYLATNYDIKISSLLPRETDIVSLGRVASGSLDLSFHPVLDERVLVFSDYWKPFSLRERRWLPEFSPMNSNPLSFFSSDLQFYLAAEPLDHPDHFVLYRTNDGSAIASLPKGDLAHGAVWSEDSSKFAFVLRKGAGSSYEESLHIYSVP